MKHCDNILDRNQRDQALLDTGIDHGFQKAVDLFSIALNRSHEFGEGRLIGLLGEVHDLDVYFSSAFNGLKVDSDYKQEELDGCLKEIYKKNFSPFKERHPGIRAVKYDKARKGWK